MEKILGYAVGIAGLLVSGWMLSLGIKLYNQLSVFRPFAIFNDLNGSGLVVLGVLASCALAFCSVMCIIEEYKLNKES